MRRIKFTVLFIIIYLIYNCGMIKKDAKSSLVLMSTSLGDIKIKLYNETPIHRDNFIKLLEEDFYDDILFHRVIKDFMIQTGDPDSKNKEADKVLSARDPGYTLPAEIKPIFFHKKGALAAARQSDEVNPKKESSGSQFYIVQGQVLDSATIEKYEQNITSQKKESYFNNLVVQNKMTIDSLRKENNTEALNALAEKFKLELEQQVGNYTFSPQQREAYMTIGGTPHLDGEYTVFGEVVEGLEVVDKIANVEIGPHDSPKEDIKIVNIKIINN